jgi:hypothetical protein
MELAILSELRISRNENSSEYTKWQCALSVRHSLESEEVIHVFYGQNPLAAYYKAVVGLDTFLKSPEFIYPVVEEFTNRG